MTAKEWVFYGNLLVAENSEEFDPALLEKLKLLAEGGAIHLNIKENGACEITPLDAKKLETFASEEMIAGINSLTGLNCSYDDGSEEDELSEEHHGRRPRLCAKSTLSPAQLMRLYRLTAKHILHAHIIGHAREKAQDRKIDAEIEIDGLSYTDLQKEVAVEARRREEGPAAAEMLSELTGEHWLWNGLTIELEAGIDPLSPEFTKRMKLLEEAGIVAYSIRPVMDEAGHIAFTLCHIDDVDFTKLRATTQETQELLNTLTAPAAGWGGKNGAFCRPIPPSAEGDDFHRTLNSGAEEGLFTWKPVRETTAYMPGMAYVKGVDLPNLRERVAASQRGYTDQDLAQMLYENPSGATNWKDFVKNREPDNTAVLPRHHPTKK